MANDDYTVKGSYIYGAGVGYTQTYIKDDKFIYGPNGYTGYYLLPEDHKLDNEEGRMVYGPEGDTDWVLKNGQFIGYDNEPPWITELQSSESTQT